MLSVGLYVKTVPSNILLNKQFDYRLQFAAFGSISESSTKRLFFLKCLRPAFIGNSLSLFISRTSVPYIRGSTQSQHNHCPGQQSHSIDYSFFVKQISIVTQIHCTILPYVLLPLPTSSILSSKCILFFLGTHFLMRSGCPQTALYLS